MSSAPTFTIVGAGLSGALLSTYLGQAGYAVTLFEKRPDPRRGAVDGGRSINLALSTRGLTALAGVGLAEAVLAEAVAMRGRLMHAVDGTTTYQPYGTASDQVIHSVSRSGLNMQLLDAAEAVGVTTVFDAPCVDADLDGRTVTLQQDGGRRVVPFELLIGSDGAFSRVRARMQRRDRFDYQQDYLSHGYKELVIPPAAAGGFRIASEVLHIWPRGASMMIALPNRDGSFTCTLFWPLDGAGCFDALRTPTDVQRHFEAVYPDAVPHMPTLAADYFDNPTSSLVTVRCGPWHCNGNAALLGDAAHAVVPFYGQGMNASFEDCTVLFECLRQNAPDWAAVFRTYYERRRPHTDALADLAVQNFYEMRDHVASRWFLFKKMLGRAVHRVWPAYVPIYSMVTFSNMPYGDAVAQARRQQRRVRRAVQGGAAVLALIAGWWMWR